MLTDGKLIEAVHDARAEVPPRVPKAGVGAAALGRTAKSDTIIGAATSQDKIWV